MGVYLLIESALEGRVAGEIRDTWDLGTKEWQLMWINVWTLYNIKSAQQSSIEIIAQSSLYQLMAKNKKKNQERVKKQKSLKHKGTSEAPIYNYLLKWFMMRIFKSLRISLITNNYRELNELHT